MTEITGTVPPHSARILLADDNEATAAAVTRFLEDEKFRVVAVVRDGNELLKEAGSLLPDVVIADILMPEMNGLDATARLKETNCATKVVILTAHEEPEFVQAAIAAGACGYVLKHRLVYDLPKAIELALRGEQFFSSALTSPPNRPETSGT